MDKAQIQHLGTLARIKLSESEVTSLAAEISAILDYVGAIDEVVPEGELQKTVGAVHNVFREDQITNQPGSYTEALLKAMPETVGKHLHVKKILNQDE